MTKHLAIWQKRTRPLLQVALDTLSVEEAIRSLSHIHPYIDIIEVGTILLGAEGAKAISVLRSVYPDKIIIADGKIADAGKVFSKMFLEAGADWITVICAAETPTIKQSILAAQKISADHEVQIEMTNQFSWDQVQEWKEAGIKQVVWHRSRDLQADGVKWSKSDLTSLQRLEKMGFQITITGGIEPEDVSFFKDFKIAIFVAGRALRDQEKGLAKAKAFHDEFKKYWK